MLSPIHPTYPFLWTWFSWSCIICSFLCISVYLKPALFTYLYIFSTGKLQIVYLLLSHNASLNTEDNDGSSTLHHAAKNGHAEVVLELIEAGASIESTDSGDWTPLIWVSTNQINTNLVPNHVWFITFWPKPVIIKNRILPDLFWRNEEKCANL